VRERCQRSPAAAPDDAHASVSLDPRTLHLPNVLDPLLAELGHQLVARHELAAEVRGEDPAVTAPAGQDKEDSGAIFDPTSFYETINKLAGPEGVKTTEGFIGGMFEGVLATISFRGSDGPTQQAPKLHQSEEDDGEFPRCRG